MPLKPEVVDALADLGLTPEEQAFLEAQLSASRRSLENQLATIDMQLSSLTNQRVIVEADLDIATSASDRLIAPPPPPIEFPDQLPSHPNEDGLYPPEDPPFVPPVWPETPEED